MEMPAVVPKATLHSGALERPSGPSGLHRAPLQHHLLPAYRNIHIASRSVYLHFHFSDYLFIKIKKCILF